MKIKTLLFLSLTTLITACASTPPTPVTWQSANRAIVEQHIAPRYQQLADASTALELQAKALCADPGPATDEKTRAAFHQTMDAWMGIQHIRTGPVELFTRYHRFELWPDKHNTGTKQLAKLLADEDMSVLAPERFSHNSVAIQGLTALERLLFDDGTPAELFGTAGKPSYRCHVIEAIALNLAAMSAELVEDWNPADPPYQMLFISTGQHLDEQPSSAALAGKREVSASFFNNMNTQIQSIIDQKLLRPMSESAEQAKPRLAESWRSRRSLQNITLNLQAVESLYHIGFAPMLRSKPDGAGLDGQIREAFVKAFAAARAIDRPLYEIVEDPASRPALDQLISANRELLSLLSGALPQALDIPFSFNALDGD